MKTVIIISATLLIVISGVCQESAADKQKIKFSSINQAGLLVGANKEAAMVQTINGIRKDKWFAGFGAGIDFYVERGVPLFLDIRRDLTDKKNTAFLYADAGIYSPWLNYIQKEQKLNLSISSGAYYDVGIGWKLKGKNKRNFLMSAGYSLKQDKGKAMVQNWNPGIRAMESNMEHYNYKYRRIVLKLGIQL